MEPLTAKQKEILGFIRERVMRDRLAPTIREIGVRFGFSSTGTVRDHLEALARKGYLTLGRQKARGIELDQRLFGLPIVGRVAAGEPKLAEQDIEGYLEPYEWAGDRAQAGTGPSDWAGYERLFCLRVKGDSMKDAGIIEGDLVVVRRQPEAEPGEVVVALFEDEATVKTLRRIGGKFYLCPANEKYKPIPCTPVTRILGRVVTVVRKYV
ncbi:MAG: transcriptional repressor LexA [Deltaproteobacteria bacterium]